jgi:outer membrane PBP1 activator LpoA protein
MIFLVAEPERARQIIPLLKFYYAGKVPVYATSLIYSGISNPDHDNDLNNIQFTDMPWVLGGLPEELQAIQQNAAEMWKSSYSHNPKLYALGADAYQLSISLNQLKASSSQSIHGGTGTLRLQENQHIGRELPWARIHNGKPITVSTENTSILQ